MTNDEREYHSLVEALSVLGKANADMVLSMLESQKAICNGRANPRLIEPALRSIFGNGAAVFLPAGPRN